MAETQPKLQPAFEIVQAVFAWKSGRSSIHFNGDGGGGNTVSNNNKCARAMLLGYRHIEMGRHQIVGSNGHAAVVVRAAIKHVSGPVVSDAHERIVGCCLLIVAVSRGLRHAIKTIARNKVGTSSSNSARHGLNAWRPGRVIAARGIVN